MKHLFYILFITFFFIRCLETDIDYDLPFEQKPIAIGFIDSVNGVRIFVGKNASVLKKDSSLVKGVTASLWSGDALVDSLQYLERNVFVQSPDFKIKSDAFYHFKATTPLSRDTLFSEKVRIPEVIPIKRAYFSYINAQKTRINLFIEFQDPENFNAYSVHIQRFKKDTLFDVEINENPLFIPINGLLITDREFQGKAHTLKLENISIEEYDGRRGILMDRIIVTLFNMNKPTYEFFQSIRTSEPSTREPFFEPVTMTNQVKNGLGVFGTYSSSSYTLQL